MTNGKEVEESLRIVPVVECFIKKGNEVLMLQRSPSRKHFPKWVAGVAGKVKVGERIDEACIREVNEETGLNIKDLQLKAIVCEILPKVELLIFIFTAKFESGKLIKTREGRLFWVKIRELKSLKLAPYLKIILPQILTKEKGKITFYKFVLDESNNIISYSSSEQI